MSDGDYTVIIDEDGVPQIYASVPVRTGSGEISWLWIIGGAVMLLLLGSRKW